MLCGFDNTQKFLPFSAHQKQHKTVKKDCSTGNGTTQRKAVGDDLKPDSYRWEIATINGYKYLRTFSKDDTDHKNVIFSYRFGQ
jgi:hypothetical protein